MGDDFKLRQLRLHADLRARLRPVRNVRKVAVYGIRATREFFDVPESAVVTLRPGREADPAHQARAQIAQDVAEHVVCDQDGEPLGVLDELHT